MSTKPPEMPRQRIEFTCDCGHTIRVTIERYQKVRCQCQVIYWALQPTRHSGLELRPWPGDYRMHRAKLEAALKAFTDTLENYGKVTV